MLLHFLCMNSLSVRIPVVAVREDVLHLSLVRTSRRLTSLPLKRCTQAFRTNMIKNTLLREYINDRRRGEVNDSLHTSNDDDDDSRDAM